MKSENSFPVRSFLRNMKPGTVVMIRPSKCKNSTIKATVNQLNRIGAGEWHTTRKLVDQNGRITWLEYTKVIRIK